MPSDTRDKRAIKTTEAVIQALDAAQEYIASLPLIWWRNGTIKGSLSRIDTSGFGMFQIASASVPAIKSHMDVVRGIVEGHA